MAFLQRPRSLQPFHQIESDDASIYHPSNAGAIENIPQKRKRTRTSSSHIISRVSTIFSSRKKDMALPTLELVDSALENVVPRRSFSSFNHSIDSEDDDIRIPSGLGSAATVYSFPVPPSPQYPLQISYNGSPVHPPLSQVYLNGDVSRIRALSSPNLLKLSSMRVTLSKKTLSRRPSSIALGLENVSQPAPDDSTPRSSVVLSPETAPESSPPKFEAKLPTEIILAILSHLPISTVTTCATISRDFATAARTSLYTAVDFEALSSTQAEKLVTVLVSRRNLTDLVTTFTCRKWPSFFMPDTGRDTIIVTHPNATLLTAAFTLALERMSNIVTLVLPAFDASLLGRNTPFRLQSLTLLQHSMSDNDIQSAFSWMDGQAQITTLLFPNLEDVPNTKPPATLAPTDDTRPPLTAPITPYLQPSLPSQRSPGSSPAPSPKPASFFQVKSSSVSPSTLDATFSSPTLLPTLTTFQAPAWLLTRLTGSNSPRRPLHSISIIINTTLYNGLRPAALLNVLHGVRRLSVRFGEAVDKRSFEKVLGAAGAALGRPTGEETSASTSTKWNGLESLEIVFESAAAEYSGRDEALYKSLQASLPRYNALSSLRLHVLSDADLTATTTPNASLSAPEQVLLDSWAKLCPTLHSVTLFSGAQWYNKRTRLSLRLPEERLNGFKFPSLN